MIAVPAANGVIRGAIRSPHGELVLYGDNGFAMAVSRSGLAEAFPIQDRDLTLLGAYADERGLIFVGERISRPVGALVEVTPTILYFLGLPVAREMDGYARTDLFTPAFTTSRPITFIPTYER